MSDILEKFDIFSEISEELIEKIKLFHIFNDRIGKNIFIVTKEDKVYAFGTNYYGKCGFGHDDRVCKPREIPELRGKQIKQFFIGGTFALGLNDKNQVFSWGMNDDGQLGRGYKSGLFKYFKPGIISAFNSIFSPNIIEISCGYYHSLALNAKGNVFSWGLNIEGEVGCGESDEDITTPVHLKSLPKIKSIHCFGSRSFAVDFNGLVFSWGHNYWYFLGHESRDNIYEPKLIIGLKNVISVGFSLCNTYFLTNEGIVYFCGKIEENKYQKTPKILENHLKFQSLETVYFSSKSFNFSNVLALNENKVYGLKTNIIQKTKYKTIFDYCLNEKQITFRTISLLNWTERYEYLDEIGNGHFGKVFIVDDKILNTKCAVKIVEINTNSLNSEKALNQEVQVLRKCSEDYVAKYYNSWIDKGHFHIQMELCSNNLQNIIEEKRNCFENNSFENMCLINRNISSHMMREIVECVQYLHQLNPPIIHRDLKPANILVNYQPKNCRFLKLCDFGIATFGGDQTTTLTMWKGTPKYMAPELLTGGKNGRNKYSTKADVYSLGIIFCDLFDFDLNSSTSHNSQWIGIAEEINKILSRIYSKRPNCSDILSYYQICSINLITDNEQNSQEHLKSLIRVKSFKNQFFFNYFEKKNIFQ